MRLLTKSETQKHKQSELEQANIEGEQLKSAISSLTSKLNQLRSAFAAEKQKLEDEAEAFKVNIECMKRDLVSAIAGLEQRKKAIEESCEERNWTARHEAILSLESTVAAREVAVSAKENGLAKKQSQMAEKADELETLHADILSKEREVKSEEKNARASILELNQEKEAFWSQKKLFEELSTSKEALLNERERELTLRSLALTSIQDGLNEQKERLATEDRAIKDRYNSLLMAEQEIKQKYERET